MDTIVYGSTSNIEDYTRKHKDNYKIIKIYIIVYNIYNCLKYIINLIFLLFYQIK